MLRELIDSIALRYGLTTTREYSRVDESKVGKVVQGSAAMLAQWDRFLRLVILDSRGI